MSTCQFKDDSGPRGAKYKRHIIEDGKCKRCKKPQFIKIQKDGK